MKSLPRLLLTLTWLLIPQVVAHADEPAKQGREGHGSLTVTNEAGRRTVYSAEDLAKLPRQTLKAKDHSGVLATYEGVWLADLLRGADVHLGKELRGSRMALYLVVDAADDYRVVFSLPEIDPESSDNPVLLADRKNAQAFDAKEGPYRLVVPHDKRQSRWVRQVTALSIQKPAGGEAKRKEAK